MSNYVLNKSSIPSGNDIIISKADTFVPVKMSQLNANNHCGPTTVLNLIKLAEYRGVGGICNKNSNEELFDMICGKMNFDKVTGGATNGEIYKGLRETVKHINTKVSINEYWFDLFSDFKRDINAGKPIYFGVNTKASGHAMIVVGYRSCSSGDYLRVIDNWTSHTEKYVLFDKKPYTMFDGAAVEFKNI